MELGLHLFPFRTQQLSRVSVTILRLKSWEDSTMPFFYYEKPTLCGVGFFMDSKTGMSCCN